MLVLQRVMLERVPWDSVASLVLGRVSVLVVCHVAGLWPSGSVALTGDGDCGASLSGEGSARARGTTAGSGRGQNGFICPQGVPGAACASVLLRGRC